jgi:hypothetical protein
MIGLLLLIAYLAFNLAKLSKDADAGADQKTLVLDLFLGFPISAFKFIKGLVSK